MNACDVLPFWQAVQCRWRLAAPWSRAYAWWTLGWASGLAASALLTVVVS